jgi:Ferritin-like
MSDLDADRVKRLRDALQHALMLEHATIPAYLCALYSIEDGTNVEAAEIIRSVVMEEMLHMVLVANVLNAVGGEPSVDHAGFVPRYPTQLPYSDGRLVVGLRRFSPEAIQTFLAIERPEPADARPLVEGYDTIGQLYAGIELELRDLGEAVFTGKSERQIGPGRFYYGGDGDPVVVRDLNSALAALEIIVEQGEGLDHTIHETSHPIGGRDELAHYFRFRQIALGYHYRESDVANAPPTGSRLAVDWDAVLPMRDNPTVDELAPGSEVRRISETFNRTYGALLRCLHRAFNGQSDELLAAVPLMYQLRYQAVALMRIPCGQDGRTAGPSFEWSPPAAS